MREEIWRCLDQLRAQGLTILVIDKYVHRLIKLADHHTIICLLYTSTRSRRCPAWVC